MADAATKNIARQKIDALTSAIGYAAITSDDNLLDNYYEKVKTIFFFSSIFYQKIKLSLMLMMIHI
jgi:hypothetical protein